MRCHFTAGIAVVSAGAVAASLVVVPPSDQNDLGRAAGTVQLTSIVLPAVPTPPGLLRATTSVAPGLEASALPSGVGELFPGGLTQYVVVALLIPAIVVLFPIGVAYTLIQDLFRILQPASVAPTSFAAAEAAPPSAEPTNLFELLVDNARILGDGLGKSASLAALAVPGQAVISLATAFLSLVSPQGIPSALLVAARASESIWTGALSTVWDPALSYDKVVPGFYVPADVDPSNATYQKAIDGAVLPATVAAVNQVARDLTAAGFPRIFEQSLLASEKWGVTSIQALDLIQNATVGAVQETVLAATSGGDVGVALRDGGTGIQQAVFGDPDAPDAHVDPYDPVSDTAPSVKRLGAVGSFSAVLRRSAGDVTNSDLAIAQAGRSEIGGGRAAVQFAGVDDRSNPSAARPDRRTPVRDAFAQAANGISTIVKDVRASVRRALSGDKDANTANALGVQAGTK